MTRLSVVVYVLAVLGLHSHASGRPPVAAQGPPCPQGDGWERLTPADNGGPRVSSLAFGQGATVPFLYGGGGQGLYRSTDCGRSWQPMSMQLTPPALRRTNNVLDLTVDRTGTLFVASFTDLLTYTENNGASWQTTSLESSSVNASPTDDGLVYAMERTQMRGYLTRSADGGRSWQRYVWGLGSGAVAADPQDATAAYVAAGGCRQLAVTCVPRGTLWHVLGPERRETLRIAEFDERTSALATSTDGSRLWVATQDGKLLQSMDGGQSWWEVTGTPYSGFLIDLAPSPQDDRLLLAVTVDGQLWAYRQRPDPQDLVPLVAAPPLPWVVVFQPTPLYDIAGQVVANAEPGDRYRVLAVESDWALVGPEDGPPEATRWISLDGRVELTGD